MKEVKVKDVVGTNLSVEDAILLKRIIKESFDEKLVLDFEGVDTVPGGFFANLLTDQIMNKQVRQYIQENVSVINLYNAKDFTRVLLGTSFN